jgi:hypothetical protein
MRTNYWTCSKFADWLRGTAKPKSGTSKEWTDWRKKSVIAHPFRYWLADDCLDFLQKICYCPYDTLDKFRRYFRNRWISQSHALVAHKNHIKRGQWCDVDGRFLPCLFDSLVDFVEIEKAAMASYDTDKYNIPFWSKIRLLKFGEWRSREAGLDHLDWEISLVWDESSGVYPNDKLYKKPTNQAIGAKEIKELYLWWTDIYPKRPDPYDASGLTALYAQKREVNKQDGDDVIAFLDHSNESAIMKKNIQKALKICRKIEEDYDKEDTAMLIRLIKVRQNLWT